MNKRANAIIAIMLVSAMCLTLASCSNKWSKREEKVVTTTSASADSNAEGTNGANSDSKDSNKKDKTDKNEVVTDKNGNVVQGNTVAKQSDTDDTTKKKGNKKDRDKADKTTDKDDSKKEEKDTTTTTTTLPYTTTEAPSPLDPVVTPEQPVDDEHVLTGSMAMYLLEQKYDKEEYVVNLVKETDDFATLKVYKIKDASLYSTVKVDLRNGKATETFKKDGKTKTYTLE